MQRKIYPLLLLLFIIHVTGSLAQSVYAPLNPDYYYLIDRMDIQGASGNIFTSVKPYLRNDIAAMADMALSDSGKLAHRLSKVDRLNLQYLQHDNWEWSHNKDSGNSAHKFIWNLYKKRNDFFAVNTKDFQLQLNPVIDFSYGRDYSYTDQSTYINTRGAELRGVIDDKVGFYAFLTDNQAAFPEYVKARIAATNTVPGEGFWGPYGTNGYDFYTARGYVDFRLTKHITTQFGQDANFIGDGYRSLMLSDYSGNYLFWKVDTKIWKFDYVNIFAQMTSDIIGVPPLGDIAYPHKYLALHYLTYSFSKKFNLGLFECITFGNTDTVHNRGYDLNYLNPVIFYKAVENGLGAPDKDHIGINWKWNLLSHVSLYGSVLLDEFNIDQLRANTGWWGNKQAAQAGLKYIDIFGIHNLDLQFEENIVPPYTYATYSFPGAAGNYSYFANYTNYMQPLADPMGANFYESIAILRFQPWYKFTFTGKLFYTIIGLDTAGKGNYGSNVMLSNTTRVSSYGNYITQGARTTIEFVSLTGTYQIVHNMFIDLGIVLRNESSRTSFYNSNDNSLFISFRWNIAQRLQEF